MPTCALSDFSHSQAKALRACPRLRFLLLSLAAIQTLTATALSQNLPSSSASVDDFQYAQKLFKEGYYDLCVSQLSAFMERFPQAHELPDAWLLMGEANVASGRQDLAEIAFRTFEVRFSGHQSIAEARIKLAESQKAQGKNEEAALTYERVLFFHPRESKSPYAALAAAQLWHQTGNWEKSRTAIYRLLEDHPTSDLRPQAHLLLVESFVAEGNLPRGLQEAERLFRSFPAKDLSAEAYFVRGRLQEQLGQTQLAQESFQDLITHFPRGDWASRASARLAELSFAQGDAAKAATLLDNAAAEVSNRDEKNRHVLRKAEIQTEAGQFQNAIATLQTLSISSADSALQFSYYYTLGIAHAGNNEATRAAEAFRQALRLSVSSEPNDNSGAHADKQQRIYLLAARSYRDLHAYDLALQICRDYRFKYPQGLHGDAMLLLEAEIQRNGLDNALHAQKLYYDLIESHARSRLVDDAQLGLAECYEAAGEMQNARIQWQRLVQFYGASEYADLASRKLQLIAEILPAQSPAANQKLGVALASLGEGRSPQLMVALGRWHYAQRDYSSAIQFSKEALRQQPPDNDDREARFILGASYYQLHTKGELEKRNTGAWQDSAHIVLRSIAGTSMTDSLSLQSGALLASLEFNEKAVRDAATLSRADSALAWFGEHSAPEELRMWAAVTRKQLFPRNAAEGNRLELLLQRVAANETSPRRNAALYELADWYWQMGDSSRGTQMLEQLFASKRHDAAQARGMLMHARKLAAGKQYGPALEQIQNLKERYFYSAYADSATALQIRILIATGRHEEALRIMENPEAFTTNASDGAELSRARLFEANESYPQAIAAYLRFLNHHRDKPEAADALLAAARLTQRAGAKHLAEGYFDECARAFPGTNQALEARFSLGEIQFERSEYTNARQLYLAVLQENANGAVSKEALKKSILCLYKNGDLPQGDAETEIFRQRFKDNEDDLAELQYAAGELALEKKNFVEAERIFRKLGKDYRGTLAGLRGDYGLGKTLLIQNKTEPALQILTEIPTRYRDHPFLHTVHLGLGDFYQANGQLDNALQSFQQVTKDSSFDHNYRVAVRSLIGVYERINLKDRALALARHYIQRFPDDEKALDVRIKIGLLLIELMQFDDAIAHLRSLKPFADATIEPEIQYYIGKSYMNSGKFELAIAELLRVKFFSQKTKLPWDVIALYDAAICYTRLNNCGKARKLFEQIVREQGGASEFGRFASNKIVELGKCAEPN